MSLDVRTLAAALALGHLVQIVALGFQFVVNRKMRGFGWWVAWPSAVVAGMACMMMRDVPGLRTPAILGQNGLIVFGVLCLYIGLMRFHGVRESRVFVFGTLGIFLVSHGYFVVVSDRIDARSAILSLALASVAGVTSWELWKLRTQGTAAAVRMLALVLALHGLYQAGRAVRVTFGAPTPPMFDPSLFNVLTYVEGIISGGLFTFGLIILVNQRLQADMQAARDDFELFFEANPEATVLTRLDDGAIVRANRSSEELYGFRREEGLGRTTADLGVYLEPSQRERLLEDLRTKGEASDCELSFRRRDGREFVGSMSARVLRLHGVPHVIGVTRDVSGQKRAELALAQKAAEIRELNAGLERHVAERTAELERSGRELERSSRELERSSRELERSNRELERTNRELERTNRELEAFVYTIAHDLRAPLRAIDGFSAVLLEEQAERLGDDGSKLLTRIRTGAQAMDRLIRDLLEYARVGSVVLRPEPIDMAALARVCFAEVAPEEVRGRFELVVRELPEATADPTLVRLVFRHLLANAVRFTLPAPRRCIEISGSRTLGWLTYRVSDTGVGFDPIHARKLFGVFQRLQANEASEGTGIGLAIVKRIVERHGGRVRAEGSINGGATFTFELPEAGAAHG